MEHPIPKGNQKEKIKLPSPQERMDLILAGLARGESIERLCQQAGVSRELFYRWMRRVKEAGMKALEAQLPGPKAIPSENPEKLLQQLQKKVETLEKKNRKLQKERDYLDQVAKVSQRIIQRQSWGPLPQAGFKKNGMRADSQKRVTGGNGEKKNLSELPSNSLQGSGASTDPHTGDGHGTKSK